MARIEYELIDSTPPSIAKLARMLQNKEIDPEYLAASCLLYMTEDQAVEVLDLVED